MNIDTIRVNKEYYKKLLQVYRDYNVVQINNYSSKFINFCTKIVLRALKNNQNIIIQVPESFNKMSDLFCSFYINLANQGFVKFVNYPDFKIGDRLKRRKKHGKEKEREFVIEKIDGDSFTLVEKPRLTTKKESTISPVTIRGIKYETIVKDYIKISDRTQNKKIESYFNLFKALNPNEDFDFIPTSFDKKIVFIGSKKTWDNLGNYNFKLFNIRNCIPAIYIPDPKDDSNPKLQQPTVKIDQPLIYFTTRYETCYNQLLTKDVIVDLITLLNADTASISQILMDQRRFSFKFVALIDKEVSGHGNLLRWKWFKEEIDLIESL